MSSVSNSSYLSEDAIKEVFDEVDEAGEVVEDRGQVVLDFVRLKESVVLHGGN